MELNYWNVLKPEKETTWNRSTFWQCYWHFDTFRVKWRDSIVYPFTRGFVTFTLNAQGKIDEMKVDVPNPDFNFKELEFKRKP